MANEITENVSGHGHGSWVAVADKLRILAGAARYDVSCASSGSSRNSPAGSLGNVVPSGICHSWAADGRCISLLKVLFTNFCVYDGAY